MTVLITGANGQVGFELVRRAGELRVVGLNRAALDITDQGAVLRAIDTYSASVLINAAAYTAVDRAELEPERAFAVNRDGVVALARACRDARIPMMHLSTDYIFDGSDIAPYRVDAAASPLGVYGRSKWDGEEAIRTTLASHLILRVAWVFGVHGTNFVRTVLRLARERKELRVVADQRGAPTPASAIAETLLALSRRFLSGEHLPWGTWHYVGQPAVSWHVFAQVIIDEAFDLGLIESKPLVSAIATIDYPTPARRPANSVLDISSSCEVLGLAPPDWRSGLREILNEWKASA
jgi:dTDP-4-dehydrorhamnose reductase